MTVAGPVVSALASTRRGIQLYPPSHPAYQESIGALVAAVTQATSDGALVINWHQGRLYHESVVVGDDVLGSSAIAEAFEARSIESLSFAASFGEIDAIGLVEVLSLRPSPDLDVEAELSARGVTSVTVAVLKDEDDEEKEERDRQREADRALYNRLVGALRQLQEKMTAGGAGDLSGTGALVTHVMERLLTDSSAILGLATIRGVGERNLFHSLNVMIYTLALGQRLGLPEEGLSSLGLTALLHDVGKAAFDPDDPAQSEAMRLMHPSVGAEILQRLSLEDPAPLLVAYEHHMQPDGGGFPERPSDYVAHPYSRMVAIADRYENLTNAAEASLTPDKAVVQLLRDGGSLLDPFFVRVFANALGVFPIGSLVRLSDQSVGVVARRGDDPLTPVVRVAYDSRGTEIDDPQELDLATSEVRIVEVIEPEALNVAVSDKL